MKAYTSDPKNVQIIDESIIKVTWKDDHESDFDSFKLRVLCPCAECRGGHGGKVGDNTKHLQPPITAKDYARVGRYALAFHFSDLHRAGIYSFDYLRDICPCEKCKGNAPQNYTV
ncbi:MAG: DUF971 domain-containing protein [Candidatus Sericytochromatia bacterium]